MWKKAKEILAQEGNAFNTTEYDALKDALVAKGRKRTVGPSARASGVLEVDSDEDLFGSASEFK